MNSEVGRILMFWAGEERYAVDLREVAEVVEPLPEYPIPRVPRFLRGVANVHGSLVSILDLALYLGYGMTSPGRELLVMNRSETALALAVERVERIVTTEAIIGEDAAEGPLIVARLLLADGPAKLLAMEPLLVAVERALHG